MRFLICFLTLVMCMAITAFAAIDTNTVKEVQGIADAIAPKYAATINLVIAFCLLLWGAIAPVVAFIKGHIHGKASVTPQK